MNPYSIDKQTNRGVVGRRDRTGTLGVFRCSLWLIGKSLPTPLPRDSIPGGAAWASDQRADPTLRSGLRKSADPGVRAHRKLARPQRRRRREHPNPRRGGVSGGRAGRRPRAGRRRVGAGGTCLSVVACGGAGRRLVGAGGTRLTVVACGGSRHLPRGGCHWVGSVVVADGMAVGEVGRGACRVARGPYKSGSLRRWAWAARVRRGRRR